MMDDHMLLSQGVNALRVKEFMESFQKVLGGVTLQRDVPMKKYTSIAVGGNADFMVEPDSLEKVRDCIAFLSAYPVPFMVMGNGSNLIFSDEGYRGVIVKIGPRLSKIEVDGTRIVAEAGASLAAVAHKALEHSLTGLEFASGIPGSTGGAACMNAGAYDGEMKQVIEETLNVDKEGRFITLKGEEHSFSYRHSRIQQEGLICLKVVFALEKGDKNAIQAKMNDLNSRRREKQPLNMPSAGSVFKRPPGQFAGKLIDDCGLRGYAIGGAQVSDKHCGFIVNTGTATAADVINLIRYVQQKVYERTGTLLEPEVKIIGGNTLWNS
jgi:UDP-N-acetylmuramate dehydrogenase